ncbi:MAG TPA: hypothetical protein VGJ15_09855 [Pirellulales bacterium]
MFLHLNAGVANSRPKYLAEFKKEYTKPDSDKPDEKAFAEAVKKAGCTVCHEPGEDKKKRNDYGKALADIIKKDAPATGFKGESDMKKVDDALAKVADMRIDGKDPKDAKDKVPTYGDVIKKMKLPVEPKADDKGKAADDKK